MRNLTLGRHPALLPRLDGVDFAGAKLATLTTTLGLRDSAGSVSSCRGAAGLTTLLAGLRCVHFSVSELAGANAGVRLAALLEAAVL